jgi:hypothetical protein
MATGGFFGSHRHTENWPLLITALAEVVRRVGIF